MHGERANVARTDLSRMIAYCLQRFFLSGLGQRLLSRRQAEYPT